MRPSCHVFGLRVYALEVDESLADVAIAVGLQSVASKGVPDGPGGDDAVHGVATWILHRSLAGGGGDP